MKPRKKRNHTKFSKAMQKKLAVLYLAILVAFMILMARMIMITKEDGEQYKKQVLSQQKYSSITLPYKRGSIIDSKGTILAVSEKVYNIILDCSILLSKEDYLEPTLQAIALCLPTIDIPKIEGYIKENPTSKYYVMEKQLTYIEIEEFQKLQQEEGSQIKGIWFEENYKRKYPYDSLACDVLGFTGNDNNGMGGLEDYYNNTLNGINGREYGYLNTDETLERSTKASIDGNSIITTIDANIQAIVEKHILSFNEKYKNNITDGNGTNNTGVIIMDPNNGEILAMASYPVFDLNNPKDLTKYLPKPFPSPAEKAEAEQYEAELLGEDIGEKPINESDEASKQAEEESKQAEEEAKKAEAEGEGSEETEPESQYSPDYLENPEEVESTEEETVRELSYEEKLQNRLWRNFCIADSYEPGSTAKPFNMATGLEYGKINSNNSFTCTGGLVVGGYPMRCSNRKVHGPLGLEGIIKYSCNEGMIAITKIMGIEIFLKGQNLFNFGLKTNIDLGGEARTDSFMFKEDMMGPTDLAVASFGQGNNVTMVQMATAFASLINGGKYYEPHIVSEIISADGATVENIEPRLLKQTISQSTSDAIVSYCDATVMTEDGTGRTSRPTGYTMGGKTGTAETLPRGNNEYVVSFIGYAPEKNPEVLIYTVIDRPNVPDQASSRYATLLTRGIMTEVLPYLNIFPTLDVQPIDLKNNGFYEEQIGIVPGNEKPNDTVSENKVAEEAPEEAPVEVPEVPKEEPVAP